MRILVAEDEKDLSSVLVKRLTVEHYCVDHCFNGEDAWDYIQSTEYDVVILDIMMPKLDGMTILRKMREKKLAYPVLLLTAKDRIEDRVCGLDAGADDYLVKPFAFEELLARLRVITRKQVGHQINVFCVGDLTVDCSRHLATRAGQVIALKGKEFAIIEYMIRNKGIVLSRDSIERHIWNYDYVGNSNIVDVYIRYLRKKIDEPFDQKLIHTIRNTGYVLRTESKSER